MLIRVGYEAGTPRLSPPLQGEGLGVGSVISNHYYYYKAIFPTPHLAPPLGGAGKAAELRIISPPTATIFSKTTKLLPHELNIYDV